MVKSSKYAETRRTLLKWSALGCLVILGFHLGTILGSIILEVLK